MSRHFTNAGEKTGRVVLKRRRFESMPARFIEERLCQAALGERHEDALELARQMPGEAEHLPFGAAVERRGHQMDDTQGGQIPWNHGEHTSKEASPGALKMQ